MFFSLFISYSSKKHQTRRDSSVYQCELCQHFHSIRFCRKFLKMDAQERKDVARNHKYCINCLAKSHTVHACRSNDTCRQCGKYHHTLLHSQHPRVKGPARSRLAASTTPKVQTQSAKRKKLKTEKGKPKPTKKKVVIPDQHILSEAIRSLATVLCATNPNRGQS